jgi:mutator family transposase
VACFEDDFEACIAHLRLPFGHRRAIRTTNLLERMFGEERRRTKVIPHAFGEKAVMKLMYAALTRARQGWRNLVITSFEVKQIQACVIISMKSLSSDMRRGSRAHAAQEFTAQMGLDPYGSYAGTAAMMDGTVRFHVRSHVLLTRLASVVEPNTTVSARQRWFVRYGWRHHGLSEHTKSQ